jgi:hypothetical protein
VGDPQSALLEPACPVAPASRVVIAFEFVV